jgi:hypothetical protein
MDLMRKFCLGVLALALLSGTARAQPAPMAWTRFVEPDEAVLSLEVPQGWVVTGGLKRFSAIVARPWFTATSPDGKIRIFLGAPDLPGYMLPKPGQAEGGEVPPPLPQVPPSTVLTYRAGAAFAGYYGRTWLAASGCSGAAPHGTRAMPEIARAEAARAADEIRGMPYAAGFTPPQHDAGLASFRCKSDGTSAGVIADTVRPLSAGFWFVPLVVGYRTDRGQEAEALAILSHMLDSRQWNAEWDQKMRAQVQAAFAALPHAPVPGGGGVIRAHERFMRPLQGGDPAGPGAPDAGTGKVPDAAR